MGAILAKLRKKKSTIEVLEQIDKDIDAIIKLKHRDTQLERQYAGTLIMWSSIFYVVLALFCYFYFTPTSYMERVYQILPFLLIPFLIFGVRRIMKWYFVKRIERNQLKLGDLRDQKKKTLEEVKEKESYKKAKEILDKYDPAPPPKPATPISATPVPRLRQRPMTARGARTPNVARSPPSALRQPGLGTPLTPQQQLMMRPPPTARPILPRERGTFDKLVDFVVGDGPSSRYALICKHCYSHNGMAMQEEFEYLAFKCAYCGTFNPSRKVRPNAPQLPVATPTQRLPPNAQGTAGAAGNRSGSEDNQSDTETGSRGRPSAGALETTNQESAEGSSGETGAAVRGSTEDSGAAEESRRDSGAAGGSPDSGVEKDIMGEPSTSAAGIQGDNSNNTIPEELEPTNTGDDNGERSANEMEDNARNDSVETEEDGNQPR